MAWGVVGSRSLYPLRLKAGVCVGGWYLNAAPGLLGQGGSQTWKLCKLDFLYYLLLSSPGPWLSTSSSKEKRGGRRAGALAMV